LFTDNNLFLPTKPSNDGHLAVIEGPSPALKNLQDYTSPKF